MCAALEVTLADLIRAADEGGAELVELGDGSVFSTAVVLGWLYEGFDELGQLSVHDPRGTQRYPFSDRAREFMREAVAERERLEPVLSPIVAWGVQHERRLTHTEHDEAYGSPSDAERHAARRLDVEPAQVRLAAMMLWGKGFDQERDARVGDVAALEPRSRQARRGLVTRDMLAEMERMLKEAGELPVTDDPYHGKSVTWWLHGRERDDS